MDKLIDLMTDHPGIVLAVIAGGYFACIRLLCKFLAGIEEKHGR